MYAMLAGFFGAASSVVGKLSLEQAATTLYSSVMALLPFFTISTDRITTVVTVLRILCFVANFEPVEGDFGQVKAFCVS